MDPLWSHLATESIKRYRSIESQSNINFFNENGYLYLFNSSDNDLNKCKEVARSQSVNYRFLADPDSIRHRFSFLKPMPDTVGLYEPSKSGAINPRKLIKAQQTIAVQHGVTFVSDIATKIVPGTKKGYMISTKANGIISADKVILCVGAFLGHNDLLPKNLIIEVYPKLIMTARIFVDEKLLAKFNGMPSISMTSNNSGHFYLMAPIKYPDGKWYIKIGLHSDHVENDSVSCQDVTDWYRKGPIKDILNVTKTRLVEAVESILPDLKVDSDKIVFDTCAIMETPNGRPYVDQIAENFYIVTGCNGYSAKSSDEFGRLIAKLALTTLWDCPFAIDCFKCKFRQSTSKL